MSSRHDRSIRFFGREGQEKLRNSAVAVVGVGGVGGHVVQQLALLGVRSISVIDAEELAETNLNRYVTARATDAIPGTPKSRHRETADRRDRSLDRGVYGAGLTR